jgi:PPIC-type PPIASE domain
MSSISVRTEAVPGAPQPAPPAPPAPAVVATAGSRKVDTVDIKRAAESLAGDPLRKKDPQAWRQSLLDLCVDRELLAADAEARGLGRNPAVMAAWADRQYAILYAALYEQVLVPGISPTPQLLADLSASGLYRGIDLNYILIRDTSEGRNQAIAQRIYDRLKAGARFDSLARIYSEHPPSAAAGGHFGWVLGRDLDPHSFGALKTAKPGDILGVYSGPYGHEIYGIRSIQDLEPDSLYRLVLFERGRGVYRDYDRQLLRKYHFQLDSTQVTAVLFTVSVESPDSIMASLGPDGTRPEVGIKPALGILARCDGDSVTMADIVHTVPLAYAARGRMRIQDRDALAELCGRALLHRLVVRDAVELGIDQEPTVARSLRLAYERILTDAMVKQARPPAPSTETLHAYYTKNAARYRMPAATIASVAVFATSDSAVAALADWQGRAFSETLFAQKQLLPQTGATAMTLYPGHYATLSLADGDTDSLTRAAGRLAPGARTGIVRTIQGFAVAQVLSREAARPMTFEEARGAVTRDWWSQTDSDWIVSELKKLRATTAIRVIPGRLDAVNLTLSKPPQGGAR